MLWQTGEEAWGSPLLALLVAGCSRGGRRAIPWRLIGVALATQVAARLLLSSCHSAGGVPPRSNGAWCAAGAGPYGGAEFVFARLRFLRREGSLG